MFWWSHEGDSSGNEGSSHGEGRSSGVRFGLGVVGAESTTSETPGFTHYISNLLFSSHGGTLKLPFSFGGFSIGLFVSSSENRSTGCRAYLAGFFPSFFVLIN